MSSNIAFRPATAKDYPAVIQMWLGGISSDHVAIAQVADTWWKRLLFKHVAGRKIFIQDMDTFVLERDGAVRGYAALQKEEPTVSVFDWGLDLEWTSEGRPAFQVMLDGVLDYVYELEDTDVFVIGVDVDNPRVKEALAEQEDFHCMDYQSQQLVADLPLAQTQPKGDMALALSHKPQHDYMKEMEAWIMLEYEGRRSDGEIAFAVHAALPSRSQLYEIKSSDVPIGYAQYSAHQAEGRFLYALLPEYWGQDIEKLLITAFCHQLAKNMERVRIRTFSAAHMQASRAALETLGLKWEPAPWERWFHLLYEEEDEA